MDDKRQRKKLYRQKHAEQLKQAAKIYRQNNKDKIRAYDRRYREKHRDVILLRNRLAQGQYRRRNRDKLREANRIYRAKRKYQSRHPRQEQHGLNEQKQCPRETKETNTTPQPSLSSPPKACSWNKSYQFCQCSFDTDSRNIETLELMTKYM